MSRSRTPHTRARGRKSALAVLLAASFAAFLATMAFGVAGASAVEESCALPGSEFQGADGNQNTPVIEPAECKLLKRPTTRDWQSDVAAKKVVTSEDAQASDNELTGKENVPNLWKLGAHVAGVTPPKDNIITAWSEVDQQAAATFLYLAFRREGANGTTFLTFELNQVKGEWENAAKSMIPCRTTGDLLISYEVSGGSIGEVVVQEWTSTKSTPVTIDGKTVQCGTEGELKGGAIKVEPSAGVQGAMNTETIENFLPDKANGEFATIGKNLFGEAALNLVTVLKEAKINPCFDFGQIWMHTRSSLATNSELHDYVSPVPLLVQSCSISGRKFDDANANKKHDTGEAYLEGWKIQLLNATTKAVVQEVTTDSEGNYTFTKVGPGTYIVQEVGQSGWKCDVPGEGTACQYEVTIDSEHLNVTEREFGNVPTSKVVTTQEPKSGTVGSKFGDSATVSGPATGGAPTPTGEVEFNLYNNETCSSASGGLIAGPIKVTLSGGKASIPTASQVTLSATGTYYWVATYGGDTNNAKAVSGCADEPVTVEKAKPSIATTPSGSVTVGEKIKDSATLKGLVEATGAGKVTFKLYSDAKCETEVAHFESTAISGSGEKTVSSGEYATTAAGTYYWIATYPGDANNESAATKCGDETVVVTKAKPSIATTPSGSVTVGENIKDSATLKGLVEATGAGKVTFKLYSDEKCEHELKSFESTGISGSGEKTVNSGEYKTTAAGTYYWIATYPGDANNEEAKTKCGDETVVVKKAQPAIVTKALSPVTVGEAIHDTATLSSLVEPTGAGTVTFKLYSDEACEKEVFKSTSAGISANGNVESGEYTTTATGTYYWTAKFSGDANNEPAESGCKAANEASVVNKTKPGITTEATTLVIVGEKIKDTAKLTNLVNATTGTVTFKLFSDSECHNEVAAAKSTSGAVTGSGTIEVSSGQYTTTATGTYFWIAEYLGDANNSPVTSGCKDTNESTVVEPAKPAIATKAFSPVIVGEPIHDTATIKGLVEPTGEGTIAFKLYSDESCTNEVFKSTSAGITANGEVESGAYTPTSTGTYYWTARFSGDTNNVAVESGCKAANESSTVEKASPSISTKATPSVTVGDKIKDTATLEGLVDQTGEGKVTFKLYSNELCEGKPVFESTSGGIGPNVVSSGEYTTTATGTYYWVASYSGDKNNEPTESGCKDAEESSAVGPASPSIATTPSGSVTVGGKIKDSATLSGLVNATGTGKVTFTLYSDGKCEKEVTSFESTGIGGSGEKTVSSGEYTTVATGTYYWIATYPGDSNNKATETKCGDETVVVNPAKPGIVTKAVSPVTVGEKIHDTATLTGLVNPDGKGTVTFKAYGDSECKTAPLFESTSAGITENGDVPSGEYTTKTATPVYWVASYSGDSNNEPAATKCGDTGETSEVEKAQPGITTKAVSPVTVGAPIHDTATLTGLVEPTGTGTVTFKAYGDSECKTKPLFESEKVFDANGEISSDDYTTTSASPVYWVAFYSGDANNEPAATKCGDTGETSEVKKAKPAIVTKAVSPVIVGEAVQDTATVSGLVEPTGTGTVTFRLYSDENCTNEVFNSTSAGIKANGNVESEGFTPTATGIYYWTAKFSGDANNEPAESGCKADGESSQVLPAQPAISTKAVSPVTVGEPIHDTAKLEGLVDPTGTGTVTFKAYSDNECQTTPLFESKKTFDANGEVSSDPYTTTSASPVYWVAFYSGDANNLEAQTHCGDTGETSEVNKTKPAITTKATPLVTVGENIKDTATLTGLVNASTGTVTFRLFSDEKCETEVAAAKSTSVAVVGSGEVKVDSGEYTTTAAGTYFWIAEYSGDSNNSPVTSGCKDTNESTVVNKAKPGITTNAVTPVTVGEKIHDTATLSGLVEPDGTGTVTFKLYSDSGCKTKVFESTNPTSGGISANGNVESSAYTTAAAGTYYWVASYSGDSNNLPASTNCEDKNETSVVEKAQPGIVTKAVTPVTVGAKIHDTATLSGLVNPDGTGTVTFKLYSDSGCATKVFESTNPTSGGIGANGDVPSSDYTTTAAGTYYWVASYSGDSNNLPASTSCKDTEESSVVEKTKPAITTKATPLVTVGENIKDTATLTGLVNASTGTVTFKLFSDENCSTEVAAAKSTSIAVSGSGTVEVSSGEFTTVAAGKYYWIAEYSGDGNNSPVTSGCKDTNESTVVNKAQPKIVTKAVTPVTVGAKIHDTATLSGLVNPDGTGTVTFKLYSDSGCATKVFESTNPTSGGIGANGDVPSSEYTTTAAGTYYWVASYSGDSNNLPASTSCKDAEETSVVEKTKPAISTKATPTVIVGEKIKDTATLTGLVNASTGKVTFKLFSDENCSTEVAAAKSTSVAVVGSGTVEVSSGEFTTVAAGKYYWIAEYSGDGNNSSVTSGCKDTNESTVVNKTHPTIATQLSASPIAIDTAAHDSATLTGASANAGGTVDYRYYASEAECIGALPELARTSVAPRTNVTGGTDVGTVNVTGGSVPNSPDVTFHNAGTYYWAAIYSGDSNNEPAASGCSTELLVVNQAKPAISTTASGSVVYGGSLHDTAHLTGGSANIAGKIVFKLYDASDTTCATVLKTVETEVSKGNGDYESPSVTVGVGSYQWIAEYSGDANNVAASTSCNDPNEQASVTEHPGIAVVKEQQIAGSGQPFTTAPLEAKVGQQINYRITVTNTGDVALALSFSDPHCDAGTITGPTGNLNADGTLPAGGVAQYFCSHVMQTGDAPQLTNAATVTGQPPSGPPVSATGSVVVNVAKVVVEAKCTLALSSIKLHGAGGSRRKPFTVSISSLGIEQITFYLDKHKLKTLTQKQAKKGQYTIKIDPRKLRYGAHTVSIKTVMTDKACAALARSGVFVHPRPPVVKPKFTG